MKEVEFVRIKSEMTGYGLGKGGRFSFDGVEAVIKQRIKVAARTEKLIEKLIAAGR